MARVQLNLKMPAELVARLRQEAAGRGVTLTALVEERLGGASPSAIPSAIPGLSDRLAEIEGRLAALEQGGRLRPPRPSAPKRERGEELLVPLEAGPAGDRLTTVDVAALLGVGRSALNNWAGRNPIGAVRDGWRLVGQERSAAGGPLRWVWERAETQDIRRNSM